jgi:N-acetylmuramoyl-L-alanine amidase
MSWVLPVAGASIVALSAPTAHAVTVTAAIQYWGNTVQSTGPYTLGYDSAAAAVTGGVAFYCSLGTGTCSYSGMDADGNVLITSNYGTNAVFYVYQFLSCNVGGQITGQYFSTWNDNGTLYTQGACVNWAASPPPPPPPPPPPKVVVIDPGHGFNCPANGMAVGAIGVTDFPPNDPPAGRLREDDLTMAIARELQRILPTSKYTVVLTKRDANDCPSFVKRGRIANEENAKAFVSVHINKALVVPVIDVPLPLAHGTSVLYNVNKSGSFNLAYSTAGSVSSSLGVNNRGVMVDDEIAVLKPTVTKMNAVTVEAARLSGTDETKLHASGSVARVAAGIKAAIDEQLGD